MVRVIRLPNRVRVTLGVYAAAWKKLLAAPPSARVSGFGHFPEEAWWILWEIRRGVDDRINRHLPWYGRGRKWEPDWQRASGHFARAVNSRQLLMDRACPAEFRGKIRKSRFHTEDDL